MNDFWLWFSTGTEHILDLQGYDHILFVTMLALTYSLSNWGKLLALVSAFTIGHSISLALSVTGKVHANQTLVEFLIALSIFISAIYNLVYFKKLQQQNRFSWFVFGVVVFFGLIHGLGFSYLLRSMLGAEQNIIWPLLYFNLGLELGQIIIVLIVMLFSLFLAILFKNPFIIFKLTVTCIIALISLNLCAGRLLSLLSAS